MISAALRAKRSYYQSIQIADETLDVLIQELRRGLLADGSTVRDTLRRVVTKVKIENDGGALHLTLPRQSCLFVPPISYTCMESTDGVDCRR